MDKPYHTLKSTNTVLFSLLHTIIFTLYINNMFKSKVIVLKPSSLVF